MAAYPWPEGRRWVRAMMVTTLDGAAAGPDGLSGSISGEADKVVFDAVRAHADAVLIGAGTMRAERYGPMRAKEEDAEARRSLGLARRRGWQSSAGLSICPGTSRFRRVALPALVLTGATADPERGAGARALRCRPLPGDADPQAFVEALEQRGLRGSSARADRRSFVISWPRVWSTRPTSRCPR